MAKRSPLKDKPLRNPGQSVEQQLDDMFVDKFMQPVMIAFMLVGLAGIEWMRVWRDLPPAPMLFSVIALLGVIYATFTIFRAMPKIRALKLARDGEKAVGQYLERLREQGYRVFHDVVGPTFNIDHVLIGPSGIFTVETKTFSKAPGPDVRVRFDGEKLSVDGVRLDRDPVAQAKGQAAWLRDLLKDSTGKQFNVRPVIVFPGWFVEQTKQGSTRNIWVLEPKALPKFLEHQENLLDVEAISQASLHLSRIVRTS